MIINIIYLFLQKLFKGDFMIENTDLPLGFIMALAQKGIAMTRFTNMSNEEKQSVIDSTSKIRSKEEMQSFVKNLGI